MPRPKAAGAKAQKAGKEVGTDPPAAAAAPSQVAADAGAPDAAAPAKKKRNNNPGVRVQGGRVYDSENGTTCHQCRQKTAEVKAKCTSCTLYFCPKCLENRYHEGVEAANATGVWRCPRCRGECNCSNCRKKQGKEATGQLANIAKKAGFGSVRDLLEKNPNAKAIQLPRAPSSGEGGGGEGEPASQGGAGGAQPARKRGPAKRKVAATAAAAEQELVADEELPPREAPMPEAKPLAAHKSAGGGSGAGVGSRRQRGAAAWAADVAEVTALPAGQAGAELAVVLEFLQVFGPKLQLRSPSLAAFAAELLQPTQLLCSAPEDSLVGAVHCQLLELVRAYWNVKGGVGPAAWPGIMRAYYAAAQLTQRQALDLRWQHGPPAVAGEIFTRPAGRPAEGEPAAVGDPSAAQQEREEASQAEGMEVDGAGGGAALGVGTSQVVEYPEGGYWAVPPAVRIAMLHALVHDALECGELRELIESSMGDALDEEKERRQQLAGVRKEAREAIARERDQQIALMIASGSGAGLTLEEQQRMLEEARQRAEAAAATAAAAKVKALTEKVHPPTVRAAVYGEDREGRRYLQLQVAPLLTGGTSSGVVVQACGAAGPSSECCAAKGEAFACYAAADLDGVAAALHPRGRREGPLREALAHALKLKLPAEPGPMAGAAGAAGCEAPSTQGGPTEAVAGVPEQPAAAGRRGKKRAAGSGKGGSKGGSPAAREDAASTDGGAPATQAPAAKRLRQTSEQGSSAERAAPRRQRGSAPVPAPAAVEVASDAGGKPKRRAGGRAGTRSGGKEAAGAGHAALPLKVDDILPAQ